MILGVDWLRSFNPVLFDFRAYRISFMKERKEVVLQGLKLQRGEGKAAVLCHSNDLFGRNGVDFQSPLLCIVESQVGSSSAPQKGPFGEAAVADMGLQSMLKKY